MWEKYGGKYRGKIICRKNNGAFFSFTQAHQ